MLRANPLKIVNLAPLKQLSSGRPEIVVGLIDGPVAIDHPDLAGQNIRSIPGGASSMCTMANSAACAHGTFVAGIMFAKRDSDAPAICPSCTLLVRPIFAERVPLNGKLPSATPVELAAAIVECVQAGARLINLSAALANSAVGTQPALEETLNYAAGNGVIVVAAAGNQGLVGSSAITRHPWVIPVSAYDGRGRPMGRSNVAHSIGRRGLGAPGEDVTSLGAGGDSKKLSGSSVAAPFVTGAIALIWSLFPALTASRLKLAVIQAAGKPRTTVVPPLMDAWAAYHNVAKAGRDKEKHPR